MAHSIGEMVWADSRRCCKYNATCKGNAGNGRMQTVHAHSFHRCQPAAYVLIEEGGLEANTMRGRVDANWER